MARSSKTLKPSSSSREKHTPKYALLSVYDKTGIVDFAKKISELGYSIISTGGTAKELEKHGIKVIPIQEITGNPESFDGRMKTISFQIESGILYDRSNPKHIEEAQALGVKDIDLVVCNLYPFEQTIAKSRTNLKDVIENIDVGGPTMIRAAAKNFKNVIVLVDPADYQKIAGEIKLDAVIEETRKDLAAKAFGHLSFYDSQIAAYLRAVILATTRIHPKKDAGQATFMQTERSQAGMTNERQDNNSDLFPQEITLAGRKVIDLRYGENPHQKGAVYTTPNAHSPFEHLTKHWGRDLSLTNITDINAGIESVRIFNPKNETAAVIIKHNSPCGIALGKNSEEALSRAIDADPESAFGGVIVLNNVLDIKAAQVISAFKDERRGNIDIIAVPAIEKKALELLQRTRKSMGIYTFESLPEQNSRDLNFKWIEGGFVLQTPDIESNFSEWKVVTKKKPSEKQIKQAHIGWKFITRIRSNAVVIIDPNIPMTRGIGTGQTSRVRATKIALEQAEEYAKNAILVSDSFFPFADSVLLATKYGISLIVQQGGSINDKATILTADREGIAMIFTGRRAFWH